METIYRCCAGLDVHKQSVEVTVRCLEDGGRVCTETRHFRTFTRDLLEMSDWMTGQGVTHVAMESTGVYWKPIYNILESHFEVLLVNARHVKQVPGRKTDIKDCQWLAQLLQHGLLRGSFIPPRPIRQLRDLTRHRAQLVAEKTRVANRIQKVLEDCNIKLASVATDILGASGRAMIQDMIEGESDPGKLALHARRRLKEKIPELTLAMEGQVSEHHRFLLQLLWDQLSEVEALIERVERKVDEHIVPFQWAVDLVDEIPGIDRTVAQSIIAEIGVDMGQYPTEKHLASWAGMSPGNNESAGKHKSGKTTKGSRWLKQSLVQAGWASSHAKKSYFSALYSRLARRRGRKRSLIAVGHSLLVTVYNMLKHKQSFTDLGADYYDKLNVQYLTKHLVKRLESLGHKVILEQNLQAA
jgi:transposase